MVLSSLRYGKFSPDSSEYLLNRIFFVLKCEMNYKMYIFVQNYMQLVIYLFC